MTWPNDPSRRWAARILARDGQSGLSVQQLRELRDCHSLARPHDDPGNQAPYGLRATMPRTSPTRLPPVHPLLALMTQVGAPLTREGLLVAEVAIQRR